MRPLPLTLFFLVSSVLCGMAWWQWKHGDFQALLGAPAVPIGERLYPDLEPGKVAEIRVSSSNRNAVFRKQENGWQAIEPWNDRMAPEAALGIIRFAAGLKSEDHAPREEVDFQKAGFGKNSIRIGLLDDHGRELADFRIGRTTPWMVEVEEFSNPVATVFVQKFDRHHKDHIYIGSGDIGQLFKEEFRHLRDHRPFEFHPAQVREILIRGEEGELTLARANPEAPWRIVRPLELPTDGKAIRSLMEGLLSLRATRLSDKSSLNLSPNPARVKNHQISVGLFAGGEPIVLEIQPAASAEDREVLATVSDRPLTVFHLPSKPEAGIVSLANLPLSVNELRDPSLTHLQVPSIVAIAIEPATAPKILLTHERGQPWLAVIDGVSQAANEENLYGLLQEVTTARALSFVSDAVTDFMPYGLENPMLILRFLGVDNQALELRFGMNDRGELFANRLGTPTVMRIRNSFLDSIAIHAHEWRNSLLLSLHRVDLRGLQRQRGDESLTLEYHDTDESWEAWSNGLEATGDLNAGRARFLLSELEKLRVARWLPMGDRAADAALLRPTLRFRILKDRVGDDGASQGLVEELLEFAPRDDSQTSEFYGRLLSDPQPFLISRETYEGLAVDLLED